MNTPNQLTKPLWLLWLRAWWQDVQIGWLTYRKSRLETKQAIRNAKRT